MSADAKEEVGLDFDSEKDARDFATWLVNLHARCILLDGASVVVPLGSSVTQAQLNRWRDEWEETEGF